MANPKVLRFFHPAYTATEWETLNPTLQAGEIGIELDGGGAAIHMKVGPGLWNDLSYIDGGVYSYTDEVTNEIGDVKLGTTRDGDAIELILKDMLSPVVAVTVSNPRNDAAGASTTTAIRNIGQTVDTSVNVSYTLNALGIPNLLPTDNISITSVGGIFSNEGLFTHGTGTISMLLQAQLAPSTIITYQIDIFAKWTNGVTTTDSNTVSTFIKFLPEVLHGASSLSSLLENEVAALPGRTTTENYDGDYVYLAADYHYVAIPQMLNPANLVFTDVTNPNNPVTMSFIFMQSYINMNNGTGVYSYDLYRSEQLLLTPKTIRIA